MKKFFVRRVLPIFMAAVMSFSVCVVPSKAVSAGAIMTILDLIGAANDIKQFAEDLISYFDGNNSDDWGDWWCSTYQAASREHAFYTKDTVSGLACDWNQTYGGTYPSVQAYFRQIGDNGYYYVVLQSRFVSDDQVHRMAVLTHADGHPIAYDPSMDEDAADPVVPGSDIYNRWIPEDDFEAPFRMLSLEELSNLATDAGADLAWNDTYYYIYRDDGNLVYADSAGYPYAAFRNLDQFASQTDRPGTSAKDENGDETELPEDFDANIDLENMLITLPNGTLAVLDSVIYDESTKSYYIDSHDTYNTTNNYYYHWEYHINYTSITYIGQTEEYNKYYEVYYELPDGRDSADLTKEDVEQLNVSVDVIPYGRNTDDVSLRSLYHFDGDTRDSSYWNYCTDFTWNEGASLTYMDAAVFEGALYLDEMIHDFTLTLPSNITAGDFTLQFRYYQSHTAAPVTDSYIAFGDETVFQMSGGYFRDGEGNNLYATPVGSWTEIALIRDSGVLYFYLNGVSIGSIADITSYSNTITFHFGDEQQTYKYFDELRVLNEALVTGGDNYTPTSVPHDTNLVLTTPDQVVPVADEYWQIENTPGYLSYLDFSQGVLPSNLVVTDDSTNSTSRNTKFPNWAYGTDQVNAEAFDNYTAITRTGDTLAGSTQVYGGIHSVVYNSDPYGGFELGKDYTISIIYRDGTVEKIPFTFANDTKGYNLQADCGLGQVLLYAPNAAIRYHSLVLNTTLNETVELVGVEVCAGDSSLTAEWVESVTIFDKDALNTPTLAVRTDLDITSYQIGGVRPSVPEKGMVWALVENERITSIQVYNGQAWEGVDGRIWTGSRWIPASSYNIITLQDMYDIVDATQDYEYIYSESGFWDWWQKSWNAFTEKLFSVLGSGGSGSGTSGADGGSGSDVMDDVDLDAEDAVADPEQEDSKSLWQFIVLVIAGGKSVVSGVRHMFSGIVSTVPDTMDDITGAFDPGGMAVGFLDGSSMDPDAADLGEVELSGSEEVDPWRYR